MSARDLNVRTMNPATVSMPSPPAPRLQLEGTGQSPSRLEVMTYNCSSMTAELYDVLCDWLQHRCSSDIIVLQETHWGLGKCDATWQIPGWPFINTADPGNRYSGVAILVSHRVAPAASITFCSWLPGRILHVKCESPHATLDLVGVYQHAWQEVNRSHLESKREAVWVALGRLLGGIPQRSLLILAGDFNGPLEHLSGHVGRGVLPSRREPDAELLQLLQTYRLVVLNTWSRVSAERTATFLNDPTRTQIDFVAVRKEAADVRARTAHPVALNLAPWRHGPRHRPVVASVPWVAGWRLQQLRRSRRPIQHEHGYSKQCLQECIRSQGPALPELQRRVLAVVQTTTAAEGFGVLNKRIVGVCKQLFPPVRRVHARPGQQSTVISDIRAMWRAYRHMKSRPRGAGFSSVFRAWRAYAAFAKTSQQLRKQSRAARRAWLTQQIQAASEAASRNDLGTVYSIIRTIAPKSRRDPVRIRTPEGHLLSPHQQFEATHQYFSEAFQRQRDYVPPAACDEILDLHRAEIVDAIQALKPRKAVPTGSPVAEIWQLHPTEFAQFFLDVYTQTRRDGQPLPSNLTHCALSLLPKPHKVSRLPLICVRLVCKTRPVRFSPTPLKLGFSR